MGIINSEDFLQKNVFRNFVFHLVQFKNRNSVCCLDKTARVHAGATTGATPVAALVQICLANALVSSTTFFKSRTYNIMKFQFYYLIPMNNFNLILKIRIVIQSS